MSCCRVSATAGSSAWQDPAERILEILFAWQHGSSKQHLPTAIFKLVLPSCEVVQLPAVTLNAPSRDDNDRLQRAQQGQGRAKVDGYSVPVRTGACLVSVLRSSFVRVEHGAVLKAALRVQDWQGVQGNVGCIAPAPGNIYCANLLLPI